MVLLIVGLVLFLGIHSVSIAAPDWRNAQVVQRGDKAWKGVYTVVSIVGFVLLVYGYGLARQQNRVMREHQCDDRSELDALGVVSQVA